MTTICVNGQNRPFDGPVDGAGLLLALGLSEAPLVVELNGKVMSRDEFARISLQESDSVELVSIVGGG